MNRQLSAFRNKYWINNKNPEMLRLVSDHLKTNKIRKNADNKLLFVIKYVSDQYKTQEMSDKAIFLTAIFILAMFLTATKIKKMCNKVVDNYAHTLEFIPYWYKTQKMCNKAVSTSEERNRTNFY